MDTACLKLNFNLLTQSIKGSRSTCCLEIVPEVSCIENFDTLDWQNESEVIEYTVPMTYTITLKKSAFKENKEYKMNSNKVYHSCVDLLMNNPQDNFGCGDVVIKENKTRLGIKEEKDAELLTVYIEDQNPSKQSVVSNKIECVYAETHDTDTSKLLNTQRVCQETINGVSSASNNTIHKIELSDIDIIRNSSTETDNYNFEKKLTLSPICSVSTDENEDVGALHDCNKSDENIESVVYTNPIQDLKHDIYFGIQQYRIFDIVKKPRNVVSKVNNRNHNRISKEVKFENFMRMMERELVPVNMLFNDIVNKCITLGIHDKMINKKQKAIDYKFASTCKEEVSKYCYFDNMYKSESNRGVYRVICDV